MMNLISANNASRCQRPLIALFDSDERIIQVASEFSYYLHDTIRYSPESIPEYVMTLKSFIEYLLLRRVSSNTSIDITLKAITPAHVNSYLHDLKLKNLSASTIHCRDAYLRTFFTWLYSFRNPESFSENYNPYADGRLKTPKPYRNAVRYVTYKFVADYLEMGFDNEVDRTIGHFIFDTGARVSEVGRVTISDLPDPNNFPDYFIYYPIYIKGSKGPGGNIKLRISLISKPVLQRVWRLYNNWTKSRLQNFNQRRDSIPVFINPNGSSLDGKTITNKFYYHTSRLMDLGKLDRKITAHMFRHGTAISIMSSDLGKNLVDNLIIVQKAFGHNRPRTSEVYTSIPFEALKNIKGINSKAEIVSRYDEADYIVKKTLIKFDQP